ncbi:MAG: family hydrolase [Herminiimonas sp.]|nr:family hydrolase [Herminiimonas sp.]
MTDSGTSCDLCDETGGEVILHAEKFRVVLVDDAQYPGFCRVVWNAHVREMSDLPATDRTLLMEAVWGVEMAVREVMMPAKMNVASLGNMVPHLHWHVIPRHADDAHYPNPVWAATQRDADPAMLATRAALLPALRAAVARHVNSSPLNTGK